MWCAEKNHLKYFTTAIGLKTEQSSLITTSYGKGAKSYLNKFFTFTKNPIGEIKKSLNVYFMNDC